MLNIKFSSKLMPVLQKAVLNTFNQGDWKELGFETSSSDLINNHGRLLRSLSWGDPDYEGHIFDVLEEIIRLNPDADRILLSKDKIKRWIKENSITAYNELYDENNQIEPFSSQKLSPKDVVNSALNDAEILVNSGYPQNAVDRMHTAFHGYLKSICEKYDVQHTKDPSITELYKLVYSNILKVNSTAKHPAEIEKILRSHANTINAINTLRNHASMAHVNDLLDKDEATLVINTVRTLLHYLEAKID
ncbi:MAG: abortive infection family protein [Alphaproteobacteria bacterium]|nr:abortive infection family protein [Alphaproteobacteria bacterium]NCQ87365.1 abortive infection family protein [Alphaproteobacteria bacterium]NCT06236.1 abortive infection family protein [Alphaproteobacteria bacterium]